MIGAMIAQLDGVADATGRVLEGRSDSMVAALAILVMTLVLAFFAYKFLDRQATAEIERAEKREEAEAERAEKREAEIRELNQFHREQSIRNAQQLEITSSACTQISEGIHSIADSNESINKQLATIDRRLTALEQAR